MIGMSMPPELEGWSPIVMEWVRVGEKAEASMVGVICHVDTPALKSVTGMVVMAITSSRTNSLQLFISFRFCY
jgi:hypothetical protein